MIKPNWEIFKAKFSENPQNNFEWLCYLLFCDEFNKTDGIFRYKNQSAIETNPIKVNGDTVAWQAKFYESSLSKHRKDLEETLMKMKRDYHNVNKLYIYSNQEWGQNKGKKPQGLIDIEKQAAALAVHIEWKLASFFESEFVAIKNQHISKCFFSFEEKGYFCEERMNNLPIYDEYFIGREQIFDDIKKHLSETGKNLNIVALTGMSGVGKTSVARNYAVRNKQIYKLIWWFIAESEESLNKQFVEFAKKLKIFKTGDEINKQFICNIIEKINISGKILIIFDNVDSYEVVKNFLFSNCEIILTSRNKNIKQINRNSIIEIKEFEKEEAVEFASGRLQNYYSSQKEIEDFVNELNKFPLLLEQSISYIENDPSMSVGNYLDEFRKNKKESTLNNFFYNFELPKDYGLGIGTVLEMTLKRMEKMNDGAISVLYICSLLGQEPIPIQFFIDNVDYIKNIINDNQIQQEEFLKLLKGPLFDYSLIYWDRNGQSINIHRIIQVYIKSVLNQEGKLNNYKNHLLKLLNNSFVFNADDPENWSKCRLLFPHILRVINKESLDSINQVDLYNLSFELRNYLYWLGDYQQCILILQKNIELAEKIFPNDTYIQEGNMNDLGLLYFKIKNYPKALHILMNSLNDNIESNGNNSPETAISYNNIGLVQNEMRNYKDALKNFNLALKIDTLLFSNSPEKLFNDYNNIGLTYYNLEKYSMAEANYLKAINIGNECNINTGLSMCVAYKNIAQIYFMKEEYEKSVNFLQKWIYTQFNFRGNYNKEMIDMKFKCAKIETHIDKDKAISSYENTIQAVRTVYNENTINYISYVCDVVDQMIYLEAYDVAENHLIRIDDLIRANHIEDIKCKIRILNNIGFIYGKTNNNKKAYDKFIEIRKYSQSKEKSNNPDFLMQLIFLADYCIKNNMIHKSVEYCNEILEVYNTHEYKVEIEDSKETILSITIKVLGALSCENDNAFEIDLHEFVIILCENIGCLELMLEVINKMTFLCMRHKQYGIAEVNFKKAMNIINNNATIDSAIKIETFINYSIFKFMNNDIPGALTIVHNALNMSTTDKKFIKKSIECNEIIANIAYSESDYNTYTDSYYKILQLKIEIFGVINESICESIKEFVCQLKMKFPNESSMLQVDIPQMLKKFNDCKIEAYYYKLLADQNGNNNKVISK